MIKSHTLFPSPNSRHNNMLFSLHEYECAISRGECNASNRPHDLCFRQWILLTKTFYDLNQSVCFQNRTECVFRKRACCLMSICIKMCIGCVLIKMIVHTSVFIVHVHALFLFCSSIRKSSSTMNEFKKEINENVHSTEHVVGFVPMLVFCPEFNV